VEEGTAAAIGAGLPIVEACGNMIVVGSGALLRNLDARLQQEADVPVQVAEDPLSSVVLGAGKMLSNMNLLRKVCLAWRAATGYRPPATAYRLSAISCSTPAAAESWASACGPGRDGRCR